MIVNDLHVALPEETLTHDQIQDSQFYNVYNSIQDQTTENIPPVILEVDEQEKATAIQNTSTNLGQEVDQKEDIQTQVDEQKLDANKVEQELNVEEEIHSSNAKVEQLQLDFQKEPNQKIDENPLNQLISPEVNADELHQSKEPINKLDDNNQIQDDNNTEQVETPQPLQTIEGESSDQVQQQEDNQNTDNQIESKQRNSFVYVDAEDENKQISVNFQRPFDEEELIQQRQVQSEYNSQHDEQSPTNLKKSRQLSNYSKRYSLLQVSLNSKDQLIQSLQEQILQLQKANQDDKEQFEKEVQHLKKTNKDQTKHLLHRITELEKLLKEKDVELESYKSGNHSLHLQDLSAISVKQNQITTKNDRYELQEMLNEKSHSELSELGGNFWLISAERKLAKNNPLYQSFLPQQQQQNGKIVNKKYDKSYWFQFVEPTLRKRAHRLLPKIQEEAVSPLAKIEKFSQKMLSSGHVGPNIKNNPKFHNSQPNLAKDDDLADEIKQLFGDKQEPAQQESKNNELNWHVEPCALVQKLGIAKQVIEQKEKFPILAMKNSYQGQYIHKREYLTILFRAEVVTHHKKSK